MRTKKFCEKLNRARNAGWVGLRVCVRVGEGIVVGWESARVEFTATEEATNATRGFRNKAEFGSGRVEFGKARYEWEDGVLEGIE
jgi:hypothetical protein